MFSNGANNYFKYIQIQFYAYNSDLYDNFSLAASKPNGVTAISIFLQVSCSFTPILPQFAR